MILKYLSAMWMAIPPALGSHLWQSTLFCVIAGLLTLMLRKNRARARYGLWLAASVKFLIPFSLLVGLGSHLPWARRLAGTKAGLSFAIEEVSQPFDDCDGSSHSEQTDSSSESEPFASRNSRSGLALRIRDGGFCLGCAVAANFSRHTRIGATNRGTRGGSAASPGACGRDTKGYPDSVVASSFGTRSFRHHLAGFDMAEGHIRTS